VIGRNKGVLRGLENIGMAVTAHQFLNHRWGVPTTLTIFVFYQFETSAVLTKPVSHLSLHTAIF